MLITLPFNKSSVMVLRMGGGNPVETISSGLSRLVKGASFVVLYLVLFTIGLSIVGRELGMTVLGVQEWTSFAIVFLTFLYSGRLLYQDQHLKLTFIVERFGLDGGWLPYARAVFGLGTGISLLDLGYWNATTTGTSLMTRSYDVSMFWIYLIIPLGGLLIIVFSTLRLLTLYFDISVFSGVSGSESSNEDLRRGDD